MNEIYVLDRIQVRPGQLQACRDRLREGYLPGAQERGLTLVGSWVTPPVELEQGNELLVLWSLSGVDAFWAMRGGGGAEELGDFWRDIDALAVRRERQFMTDSELG